jgi:hypothetical protein
LTSKPYSLLSRFKNRLFLSPSVGDTWPKATLFDRIAVRQQLLVEIDPEGDFTETYTTDRDVRIANYQLAVEAGRRDRCFCKPGADSKIDSEEANDICGLGNEALPMSENGLVNIEYVRAVCPRSGDHKIFLGKDRPLTMNSGHEQ